MTLRSPYRYMAQATARDGRHLADLALAPDFAPAAECAHLAGVRAGALPALAHHGPGMVEPVFDPERGRPYVRGVRVRFDAGGQAPPVIPWPCFQGAVEAAAARLVAAGKLRAGETFVYRICAFPAPASPPATREDRDAGDAAPVPLALVAGGVEALGAGAVRLGEAAWDAADVPVYLRRAVLEEATRLARAAGARETGGILIGCLRRDRAAPEIHVEVSAQIAAVQARAGRTHLRFTPATWSAMRDALALRGRGELMLGWWHSHPHWCRRCPAESRRRCALARPFFSRDDCALHRTVFDAGFHVALLLSDTGTRRLSYDLFGWRDGRIAPRGAYLVPDAAGGALDAYTNGARPGAAARILTVRETDHEH